MRKIREMLRLQFAGMSPRQIAASVGSALSTVQGCLRRACVFRLMPATDSAAWRPLIPRHAGRVFRGMAATPLRCFPIRV